MTTYPTFDPGISLASTCSLSNGNKTVTCNSSANGGATTASPKLAGKWYFEISFTAPSGNNNTGIGLRQCGSSYSEIVTAAANAIAYFNGAGGNVYVNGTQVGFSVGSIGSNTIGAAIDLDHKTAWFRIGGGTWNNSGTANPATNIGGYDINSIAPGEGLYPFAMVNASGDSCTINFGASAFANAAPSGFSGWDDTTSKGAVHIDVDSFGNAQNTGSTSHTLSVSCNGANRKIVIVSFNQAGTATVSSVTATGLTFSQLTSFAWLDGSNHGNIEVWAADSSGSFSAKTVTVTYSAAPDNAITSGFAVTGYTSIPLDVNSPWTNAATSTQGTVTVTTANKDDLVIAAWTNINTNTSSPASGYSKLCNIKNGSGVNFSNLLVEAQCETSILTSASITTATMTSNRWGMLVFAFQYAPNIGLAVGVGAAAAVGVAQKRASGRATGVGVAQAKGKKGKANLAPGVSHGVGAARATGVRGSAGFATSTGFGSGLGALLALIELDSTGSATGHGTAHATVATTGAGVAAAFGAAAASAAPFNAGHAFGFGLAAAPSAAGVAGFAFGVGQASAAAGIGIAGLASGFGQATAIAADASIGNSDAVGDAAATYAFEADIDGNAVGGGDAVAVLPNEGFAEADGIGDALANSSATLLSAVGDAEAVGQGIGGAFGAVVARANSSGDASAILAMLAQAPGISLGAGSADANLGLLGQSPSTGAADGIYSAAIFGPKIVTIGVSHTSGHISISKTNGGMTITSTSATVAAG